MVSQKLREALWNARASGLRNYEVARDADVSPSVLSSLINDIVTVRRGDPRVVRVGRILGVPADECFEGDEVDVERLAAGHTVRGAR